MEQLSVFLQNESGKIFQVVHALAEKGIDIRAISIADTTDFGILRLLVSDTEAARKILSELDFVVSVNRVVIAAVPDKPGGLESVLKLLYGNRIDIEYMYSLTERSRECAYMVFRVSDNEKTSRLLLEHGFEVICTEDINGARGRTGGM